MDHGRFRDWFSGVDELKAAQRKEVAAVLSDPLENAASLAAIELGVDETSGAARIAAPVVRCRGASRADAAAKPASAASRASRCWSSSPPTVSSNSAISRRPERASRKR